MDPINVIWPSFHDEAINRGYWDQAILEDIFKQGDFRHHNNFGETMKGEGAIVIINGRMHVADAEQINQNISTLAWVLFIVTGDEEALFPWRDVKHKLMRVWIQLPRMNQHDDVSFHLPNGYRPQTMELYKNMGQKPRDIAWSFIGQVNHERRNQCFDVLTQFKPFYDSAVLVGTDAFGKEVVPYPEYLQTMAMSKIVLCPSGIESPDNFRLYEALEAGALPVVDAFSTNNKSPGFWRYLFGDDIPFPIIDYWDALPDLLPELLKDFPENANRCFAWWQGYKRKIKNKLYDDVMELSK